MINIKKIKMFFFAPRWHFSRFELNLFTLIVLSIGLTIGTYLTLYNVFPKLFAVNDTSHTFVFNSANAGNYTYDSSLITVDNSGAKPKDGGNLLLNGGFNANNNDWNVGIIAPTGWVEVPGNSAHSTSNFLVMKYEAKCALDASPTVGLTTPTSSVNSYTDSTTNCTAANARQVVSIPSGYPIASIVPSVARTRCSTLNINGSPTHLVNNGEWMSMSKNLVLVDENWTEGSYGNGYIFAGNNDGVPNLLNRPASATDTGDYACAYTDGVGNVENPSPCPTNTAFGTSGAAGNQKRVLRTSYGGYIWDVAGGVYEFTDYIFPKKDAPVAWDGTNDLFSDTWSDYFYVASSPTGRRIHYYKSGSMQASDIAPDDVLLNGGSGIGRLKHFSDPSDTSTLDHVFIRSGAVGNSSNAGVFSGYLSANSTFNGGQFGFRCASESVQNDVTYSVSVGRNSTGGNTINAITEYDAKIFQFKNVGDTSTYDYSTYVYDNTAGNVGGTVTSSIAQLLYNGNVISTSYSDVGSGWWKLSATITGANESREFGLLIKTGKTVVVDDFNLAKQGEYTIFNSTAYSNGSVLTWDSLCQGTINAGSCSGDGVVASGNANVKYQICTDDGTVCESGGDWMYWNGSAWVTATNITTDTNLGSQITQTQMNLLSVVSEKISVKMIMNFEGSDYPTLTNLSIGLTTDVTNPTVNASSIVMNRSNGGTVVSSNEWTNNPSPYFSWTAGSDNPGGVGLRGYCLYLGTDSNGDPASSKGLLGTSPVPTDGSPCQFIVSGTNVDFSNASYKGSPWLVTSDSPYYLNVKSVDMGGNIYLGSSTQFQFRFDNTPPSNVSYISCPGGSFANVVDMNFSWPTTGITTSADNNSGVLGWQYQINSIGGTWLGNTTESFVGINNYLPISEISRSLTSLQDGGSIVSGSNIVYFRTADIAGNVSTESTYRTCSLEYGGSAPTFGGSDSVTITPSTSAVNSFGLSWPASSPAIGQTVTNYYYMVNTLPPASLSTLTSNPGTYFDNGNSTTVSTLALPNVNMGSNTVYVVSFDNDDNYSPSNYITGTFTLNSTNPDNVGNLVASDSSIKADSKWYATLTWSLPSYQGAGNLTYLINRSTDGISFTQVGTTTGLSFVDNVPTSSLFYYKIYTKDGANSLSSGTNAVSITPTGRFTVAPELTSVPIVESITTKKATIKWSTNRTSDSRVAYGTQEGVYFDVEPSSSAHVTAHVLEISNLTPATKYYYITKWTDEDGNTGQSSEGSFTTDPAPIVYDVSVSNVGLTSGIVKFSVTGASKVKIYFGKSTSFGGIKEVATSVVSSTYTTSLENLSDGSKYYFKINPVDSDDAEYEGTVLDLTTIAKPKISNIKLEAVSNSAQTTIKVTWNSNTAINSIISYYPEGKPAESKEEVNVVFEKGNHQLFVKGLKAKTNYLLIIKGVDKLGNEAVSDTQRFTTATDTRAPQVLNLKVIGGTIPPVGFAAGDVKAQLIVTWDTDEPSTSQVEFGIGSGDNYAQKSQFDGNLSTNHTVILSGLIPSQVYHLRALSQDSTGNPAQSTDLVIIAPKATRSAFDLVIKNLSEAFGFIDSINIK